MRSSLVTRNSLSVAWIALLAVPGWTRALQSQPARGAQQATKRIAFSQHPLTKFGTEEGEDLAIWGGWEDAQLSMVVLKSESFTAGHRLALLVYLLSSFLVAAFVIIAYWSHGFLTMARILLYLLSSAVIKMAVKLVLETHGFAFPKFLSTLHVAVSAAFGFAMLLFRRFRRGEEIIVPTPREFFVFILPLSCGFTYALGAGNVALVFCTAAFVEIISSATPLFSVALLVVTGEQFPLRQCTPLFVMILGCTVTIKGDLGFSATGLACCLLSNLGRSVKVVFQQKMLSGDLRIKYDFATLLAWMCSTSLPLLSGWCCATEGKAPFVRLASESHLASLCFAMVPSCILATVMNYSHMLVVNELGAVGIQVVAQTKSVLTVLGGVALFHEMLSPWGVVGYVLVMCGAFVYARMDNARKAEARKFKGKSTAAALVQGQLGVEKTVKDESGSIANTQTEVKAGAGPSDGQAQAAEKVGKPRMQALARLFRAQSAGDRSSSPPCLGGVGCRLFAKAT